MSITANNTHLCDTDGRENTACSSALGSVVTVTKLSPDDTNMRMSEALVRDLAFPA